MIQRVLVLGGNGFIGKRVVHLLRNSNWAMPVVGGRRPFPDSDIEYIKLDATDPQLLQNACDGVSAVINCITGDKQTIIDSSRLLFEVAASRSPALRVVHLSSMAVYGSASGTFTETSSFSSDLGPYAEAKIAAEMVAKHYQNVVCLRPGIVYGPGSSWWSDRIARLLMAGRLGNLGANGTGTCNLVYVDDVAKAALSALQLQESEDRTFNLANPEAISWNEYFETYANALGLKRIASISSPRLWAERNFFAIPYKIAEILESKHMISGWHPAPAIRPWLLNLCRHHIVLDSSRATQALGMQWTPLDSGLRTTAHWFIGGGRV